MVLLIAYFDFLGSSNDGVNMVPILIHNSQTMFKRRFQMTPNEKLEWNIDGVKKRPLLA